MEKMIFPNIVSKKKGKKSLVEKQVKLANIAFSNGNYDKALKFYYKIIDNGYKYPDVYNKIGIILNHKEKHYEAIEAFKSSLRLNPKYIDALINLGIVYSDLGDDVNAIIEFKKALEIDPNNSEALFNLRLITKQETKGLAQPSNRIELLIDIGKSYYEEEMYTKAADKFKKVIKQEPNYYDIKLLLANSYMKDAFYKEAEKAYKDLILKKPDWYITYLNLGTLYYYVHKYKSAIEKWEKAIEKGADADKLKKCIKDAKSKLNGLKLKEDKHND